MNKALNKYQSIWLKDVFEPYIIKNPNASISYPFFLGVSEKYENATKRIMIVGQETRGWTLYKPDWTLEDSQKWTIDYLNYQLHYDDSLRERFGRRNSSPFWSFFKQFSNDDIVPCWNNIDKAQRYFDGKTMSLTEEIEFALNKSLPNSNKTLFQMEIDITKPDVIVFITGPCYYATMEAAMNLEKDSLKNVGLSYNHGCVDITNTVNLGVPTYWTYHPRHIASKKNELCRNDIVKTIKKGFNI